jgi:hypothetical protein
MNKLPQIISQLSINNNILINSIFLNKLNITAAEKLYIKKVEEGK